MSLRKADNASVKYCEIVVNYFGKQKLAKFELYPEPRATSGRNPDELHGVRIDEKTGIVFSCAIFIKLD